MKWMFIIVMAAALSLISGCAKDATASDTIWIAIIMTWNPVMYTIDKEFTSEVECWNYYDNGAGESKMLNNYGIQVLDHQDNKPDKEYMKKHRPPHREYPTRMYKNHGGWMVWLKCDIKSTIE
jgi:hypothetical protein